MWVVLAVSSNRKVVCFGTDTGKVFTSPRSAERMRKRLTEANPYERTELDFFVVEITSAPGGGIKEIV